MEKERPLETLEVDLEKEERFVEYSLMKNEQERCQDGFDGYEDDLEWYEEWMQAEAAGYQPA